MDVYSATPYLTNRGRYLINCDKSIFHGSVDVDFCFTFKYLQLIVHDKLLAIPRSWSDKIFDYENNYGYSYLYKREDDYHQIAPKVINSKFRSVLYFLKVLESSLEAEKKQRPNLFSSLDKGLLPDFDSINNYLIQTIKRIARTIKSIKPGEFEEEQRIIRDSTEMNQLFESLFVNEIRVEA
jgi:hypothetical protein